MTPPAYDDIHVGDRVYCLAWIGQPFDVVHRDDDLQLISIETPASSPTFGQIDIFPETMFLLTHEQWDQIWYWPDRAGERYTEVFDRFLDAHHVGDVIAGFHGGDGLLAAATRMTVALDPNTAMMFRITSIDRKRGEIRVEPVAAIGADETLISTPVADPAGPWLACGPAVPLRLEMRMYRWCLCFGELVVNWQDLSAGDLVRHS